MAFVYKVVRYALAALKCLQALLYPNVRLNERNFKMRRFHTTGLLKAASWTDQYELGHNLVVERVFAEREGAFIDVGANVGQNLLRVLTFDRGREHVGFESQLSSALGIESVPVALSDCESRLKCAVRFDNDTTASSKLSARPKDFYRHQFAVPSRRGDTAFADLGIADVAVIKIDVEGAEVQVLEGFAETIQRSRPVVLFECPPKILLVTGVRLSDEIIGSRCASNQRISQYFRELDYDLFEITPDDEGTLVAAQGVVAGETAIKNYIATARY